MIATSMPGVDAETATQARGAPEVAWGDRFIYYDPRRDNLPTRRGVRAER
jgi:hypothetical protein